MTVSGELWNLYLDRGQLLLGYSPGIVDIFPLLLVSAKWSWDTGATGGFNISVQTERICSYFV